MRVYFMSDYANAPLIRRVHRLAPLIGVKPTSRWAEEASLVPERLDALGQERVRAIAAQNDRDLASSHIAVVVPREGVGGEMFCEAARALDAGIPLVWAGSRTVVSAYREGVLRLSDFAAAGPILRTFAAFLRWQPLSDDEKRAALWLLIEWTNQEQGSGSTELAASAP
jgi:hypothetical protein